MTNWAGYHLYLGFFDPDNFQFTYYGFEWVRPFPEPWMSLFFWVLMIAALLIALGKWYRICTVIFFLGFTYTYFLEKANYLNHGYLFCWLCFVMIFLPAHRNWSLDVLRRPALRRKQLPYWPVLLLCTLMGIVYFYGGLAKLNSDWLRAVPLLSWLDGKERIPVLGYLYRYDAAAWAMAYGGLLLDLFVVFFLLNRRTRPWAFGFAVLFHTVNVFTFGIGIFPYLSIVLTSLYFPPDFPRRLLGRLAQRWPRLQRWGRWYEARTAYDEPPAPLWQGAPAYRPAIVAALTVTLLFHLLLPFRHHLFPGNVTWTEEGHRYSWRMMLRSKSGYGHFTLRSPDGRTQRINPREYLHRKQLRKLYTHPDMILQFAHFLRDQHWSRGDSVAVYCEIRAKMNDRKYYPYIDPNVDLARVEWSFFRPSPWILPLPPADTDEAR